jgi:glycosyltransferase involved in cell wall biosynthesis
MRRVLVISNAQFKSGAELSLLQFLKNYESTKFQSFLITSDKNYKLLIDLGNITVTYMPLEWFYFTKNPFVLLKFLFNLIILSFKLVRFARYYRINIIYTNTIKSQIYGVCLKLITRKKLIWHIRDNVKWNFLSALLAKHNDMIICVSQHIYNQLNVPSFKKKVIYGGVDTGIWNASLIYSTCLRRELNLPSDIKLIAQVGQLTKWKNQTDFINAAAAIVKRTKNVHFILVGDDLSGLELKYKTQLETKVCESDLRTHFTFLGYREDIKEIISQVDILTHTAIHEPFGRVIVEAMALEKPVVAYDGGGPSEIILNPFCRF